MLGRLVSDCDYWLGYGNRCDKHLWADNPSEQIWYMRYFLAVLHHNRIDTKVTHDDITNYAKKMGVE